MSLPLVTLTTDFGRRDPYVASMKGVIYRGCPVAQVADLTHEIAPQDVREAAFFIAAAAPCFRAGTVHVVVVDPGVGTARRPLVVCAGRQYFVCPDNGLLSLYLQRFPLEEAYAIENPEFMRPVVSPTFHGRDIFAATAARLAAGVDLHGVGPRVDQLAAIPFPEPIVRDDAVEGEIVHVDHFGNAISNVSAELVAHWPRVQVEAGPLVLRGLSTTYADAAPGEPLVLTGSTGFLELAVNRGSAQAAFGLACGTPVRVVPGKA